MTSAGQRHGGGVRPSSGKSVRAASQPCRERGGRPRFAQPAMQQPVHEAEGEPYPHRSVIPSS